MSAQRQRDWRTVAAQTPPRLKRSAVEVLKRLIAGAVRTHPQTAFRLAAFIEHIATGHLRRRAKLAVEIAGLGRTRSAQARALLDLLSRADASLDHPAVLGLLAESGQLDEATLHRYLTALFVARRLDVMERVLAAEGLGFPGARLFHQLKLRQYRGLTAASVEAIADDHAQLAGHPLFRDAALNLAIDSLVRLGDEQGLTRFLAGVAPAEFARVAPATFFGCFRLLQKAGQAEASEPWRQAFLAPLSAEQRLYHLEMLPAADPDRLMAAADWRPVVVRFAAAYSAANSADREFLTRHVLGPLAQVPAGPLDGLNIRFDEGQRRRLLGHVTAALTAGQPLSMVRLGDGEAYGYAIPEWTGFDGSAAADDNAVRERMWWGATIDAQTRATVSARFRDAVAAADIIGIPSIYRLIRDRSTPGTAFGETGAQRGLAIVLGELGRAVPVDRWLTEERCHQILFPRPVIEELAAIAQRVVLVSCWRKDQLSLTARDVREVLIPAHTKVAGLTAAGTAGGAEGTSLAHRYEPLVAEMAEQCGPGTLVLVGAGFIGKIFCAAARERGAVALDAGAMLDYFAGYKTRSLADLG